MACRLPVAVVFLALGCARGTPMPGDESMGVWALAAEPLELRCELPEVSTEGFSFEASFSRDTAGGGAWFALNGVVREASFDGQYVQAGYEAPRVFGDLCAGCTTALAERFSLALLSKSQSAAAGDACPADALDGGIPSGDGVTPPGSVEKGFDAVRACGVLVNEVVATALEGQSCDVRCERCVLRYRLVGARR